MSTRKQFLAAAAAVPLVAAAPPPAAPEPAATATPKKREISAAAKALAQDMRKFDSALTDKEIEEIAGGIDYNLRAGDRINPHGTALKNWDEPVTVFEVPS